jgi:hypothetical protein
MRNSPRPPAPPEVFDTAGTLLSTSLLRWYRDGLDPSTRLHQLSTFMGHVDPVSTAAYLTITPALLQEASRRFEAFAEAAWAEATP